MTEQEQVRTQNRMDEIAFDATLRQNYEREDARYRVASQARDWLIIAAIGAFHFAWMLVVFLLEPGIR